MVTRRVGSRHDQFLRAGRSAHDELLRRTDADRRRRTNHQFLRAGDRSHDELLRRSDADRRSTDDQLLCPSNSADDQLLRSSRPAKLLRRTDDFVLLVMNDEASTRSVQK